MVPGVIVREFAEMLARRQPVLSETWAGPSRESIFQSLLLIA
jgi:hypothetical protein